MSILARIEWYTNVVLEPVYGIATQGKQAAIKKAKKDFGSPGGKESMQTAQPGIPRRKAQKRTTEKLEFKIPKIWISTTVLLSVALLSSCLVQSIWQSTPDVNMQPIDGIASKKRFFAMKATKSLSEKHLSSLPLVVLETACLRWIPIPLKLFFSVRQNFAFGLR